MSKKIATKSKGVSQSKNAQPKDKTQKILIIATVVTVIVAALAIILSVALANRGPAEDATLAELKTNGFGELIFVMSDGTEVNAGSIPSNHEGIKIISAKRDGTITTGTENGKKEQITITCRDAENREYVLRWNIPKFGIGCSLFDARINRDGYLIFTVKQNGEKVDIKQGLLLKLSTPEDELTPSGKSEYATTADHSALTKVEIKVKGYGTITVALDNNAAPETVAAFLELVEDGYYNGLTFNKILDSEKYGDSASYVLGGISNKPADKVTGEFSENGYMSNYLSHKYGTVSLYHKDGDNNSGTSGFFICTADNTELDGKYAAFGYVISGMNIVEEIAKLTATFSESDTLSSSELEKYRSKQAVIESITVKQ